MDQCTNCEISWMIVGSSVIQKVSEKTNNLEFKKIANKSIHTECIRDPPRVVRIDKHKSRRPLTLIFLHESQVTKVTVSDSEYAGASASLENVSAKWLSPCINSVLVFDR